MVGSFAEFERAMIRKRTSAGLAVARAAGKIGGRRKNWTSPSGKTLRKRFDADMARLYNVSEPTVSRIVAEHRHQPV